METWSILTWLDTYTWLVAIVVTGIQYGFRRIFPPRSVRSSREDSDIWRSFLLRFSVLQGFVFFVCFVFQYFGGYVSFRYVLVEENHLNPYILLPRIAIFGLLASFLAWVQFAGGAQRLVHYGYTGYLRKVWMVKIYNLLFVLGLIWILTVAMFTNAFR